MKAVRVVLKHDNIIKDMTIILYSVATLIYLSTASFYKLSFILVKHFGFWQP